MKKDRQAPSPRGNVRDSAPPSDQTTRRVRLREDYIVAALILLFSAIVIGITTMFEEVPAALSQGIPPEQFPRLTVGVIVLLALLLAFQAQPRSKRKRVPTMAYYTAALLVVFVAITDLIGTITTMVLFSLAMPVLWGERRYLLVLTYAMLFPIAVYTLFSQVLEVRFPLGLLGTFLS
jgi:putative tricarboxylic transport membrane protein